MRKGLSGTGDNRCFQTVEVTLKLDSQKRTSSRAKRAGGTLITEEEYEALIRAA